jgi:hypothetical protein
MTVIKFGTDGWRALIAQDFTTAKRVVGGSGLFDADSISFLG